MPDISGELQIATDVVNCELQLMVSETLKMLQIVNASLIRSMTSVGF